jgi:transcriptional/translational regulatory protein YebC/TACO1
VDRGRISEDDLLLVALEAGAEDVRSDDGAYEVITAPEDLNRVREALTGAGIEVGRAEITLLPRSTIPVHGPEAERLLRLLEALEDLDDVQQVYANFDIPEEILQRVG